MSTMSEGGKVNDLATPAQNLPCERSELALFGANVMNPVNAIMEYTGVTITLLVTRKVL